MEIQLQERRLKMKKIKQSQIANELGISKSYLSMILSGQRKCPPELTEELQSIPGVHKVVNNQLWDRSYTQEVRGLSPLPPTFG
jgi:transcriptional regulator with XRE-family HTH domain